MTFVQSLRSGGYQKEPGLSLPHKVHRRSKATRFSRQVIGVMRSILATAIGHQNLSPLAFSKHSPSHRKLLALELLLMHLRSHQHIRNILPRGGLRDRQTPVTVVTVRVRQPT